MPSYRVTFGVSADSIEDAAALAEKLVPEFTEVTVEPVEPFKTWGAQ